MSRRSPPCRCAPRNASQRPTPASSPHPRPPQSSRLCRRYPCACACACACAYQFTCACTSTCTRTCTRTCKCTHVGPAKEPLSPLCWPTHVLMARPDAVLLQEPQHFYSSLRSQATYRYCIYGQPARFNFNAVLASPQTHLPVDSEQRDFAPDAGSEPADATRVSPASPSGRLGPRKAVTCTTWSGR